MSLAQRKLPDGYERRGSGLIAPRAIHGRHRPAGRQIPCRTNMSMLVNPYRFAAAGGGGDPYFANVVLLLGFDASTNGSQAVTDESSSPKTVSWSGASTLVDNTHTVFSSAEALKLATADGYISVPNTSAFSAANTNDKTWEAWIYITSNSTRIQAIFSKDGLSGEEYTFGISTSGTLFIHTYIAGSLDVNIGGSTAVSINTWHHVAFCRASGTWYAFLDGVLQTSHAQTGAPTGSSNPMYMGKSGRVTGQYFTGWMDEIRVTDTVARYTSTFTAPTAKFPRS